MPKFKKNGVGCGELWIKLQMYSNAFCGLDCISKSSRERKRLDFCAESGNKGAFLSGNHEILIIDTIALFLQCFINWVKLYLLHFIYPIQKTFMKLCYIVHLHLESLSTFFFNFYFESIEFGKVWNSERSNESYTLMLIFLHIGYLYFSFFRLHFSIYITPLEVKVK